MGDRLKRLKYTSLVYYHGASSSSAKLSFRTNDKIHYQEIADPFELDNYKKYPNVLSLVVVVGDVSVYLEKLYDLEQLAQSMPIGLILCTTVSSSFSSSKLFSYIEVISSVNDIEKGQIACMKKIHSLYYTYNEKLIKKQHDVEATIKKVNDEQALSCDKIFLVNNASFITSATSGFTTVDRSGIDEQTLIVFVSENCADAYQAHLELSNKYVTNKILVFVNMKIKSVEKAQKLLFKVQDTMQTPSYMFMTRSFVPFYGEGDFEYAFNSYFQWFQWRVCTKLFAITHLNTQKIGDYLKIQNESWVQFGCDELDFTEQAKTTKLYDKVRTLGKSTDRNLDTQMISAVPFFQFYYNIHEEDEKDIQEIEENEYIELNNIAFALPKYFYQVICFVSENLYKRNGSIFRKLKPGSFVRFFPTPKDDDDNALKGFVMSEYDAAVTRTKEQLHEQMQKITSVYTAPLVSGMIHFESKSLYDANVIPFITPAECVSLIDRLEGRSPTSTKGESALENMMSIDVYEEYINAVNAKKKEKGEESVTVKDLDPLLKNRKYRRKVHIEMLKKKLEEDEPHPYEIGDRMHRVLFSKADKNKSRWSAKSNSRASKK